MFLLIDNYDSFTYNLVQAFQTLGRDPLVLCNDDPRILDLAKNPDLKMVCISPGPSNPQNAGYCLEFLALLPKHIPVLGVCLGHQCLGAFAGAEVVNAPFIMHGKTSEIVHDGMGLFEGLPNPMLVGRYHSLVVAAQEDNEDCLFEVTARAAEGEVMALRYLDRPWVGIQFHPESILTPDGLQLLGNFPSAIEKDKLGGMSIRKVLEQLANKQDLDADMAAYAFKSLMDGLMSPAQAGSFLMGLRMKGESPLELAHAASIALARSIRVDGIEGDCIDVVGTGGDGKSSFNCSTATSLTLAGMGYNVVKHGNRAVSSSCGSADALEALNFPLEIEPEEVAQMLKERHFAFLFAPRFHPSFKHIGGVRVDLGLRTLFNLLGPLLNPARPSHLFLGVARLELVELLAETIKQSHIQKALVVHGAGGYDEISPLGISTIMMVEHGKLTPMLLDPGDFGIEPCTEADLFVENKEEAVAVLKKLLAGEGPLAMQQMLILNVGLAIFLLEDKLSLETCMARAHEAVHAGVGRKVLHVA